MEIVFFVWIDFGFDFGNILLYCGVDVVCFGKEIFGKFRNVVVGNVESVMYYEDLFVGDVVCVDVDYWNGQSVGDVFCQFNWYVFQY